MRYVYPCILTPDDEEGEGFVVTFPDVPEAITGGKTREEAARGHVSYDVPEARYHP